MAWRGGCPRSRTPSSPGRRQSGSSLRRSLVDRRRPVFTPAADFRQSPVCFRPVGPRVNPAARVQGEIWGRNPMSKKLALFAALLLVAGAAAAQTGSVEVRDAWARATPGKAEI